MIRSEPDKIPSLRGLLSVFVVAAMDDLGSFSCCTHVCARCFALQELQKLSLLDGYVRPYIDAQGCVPEWWDAEHETVSLTWLAEHWCDPVHCEARDDA